MKKHLIFYVILSFAVISSKAQLVIDNTLTPTQLVQNILVGSGVAVSNIQYTGSNLSISKFDGSSSNIGIPSGVILSTGNTNTAIGPNNSGSEGENLSEAGDADLTGLAGTDTYDASILSFDFIPASDTLRFNYVFGSEEYNEYVCSDKNDIFAFFLSGPNPAGGIYNKQNLALIPNTNTPVAINSVNNGSAGSGYNTSGCTDTYGPNAMNHSSYFISNASGSSIQYDGFTKVFTAQAIVTPCQTYHIKIAIADGGDGAYDSGVFLQAKSFSAPSLNLTAVSSTGDSTMAEGCGAATYFFTRGGIINDTLTIKYSIGGSASNGTDYADLNGNAILDSVVFFPGDDTVSLIINPIWDGVTENTETITLTIPQVMACDTIPISATIYLLNVDTLNLSITPDSSICDGSSIQLTVTPTDGIAPFTYFWNNGKTTATITETPILGLNSFSVDVTDSCGNQASQSVNVTVNPIPTSDFTITDKICNLQDATIQYTGNAPATANYQWDFNIGQIITGSGQGPFQTKWLLPGKYEVKLVVTSLSCTSDISIDSIEIVSCPLTIPNVITPNGDGVNDQFRINNIEYYSSYMLQIFNRWGKKIYESSNYINDWNGDNASAGTYFYILNLKDKETYQGTITVLR